MIDQIEEMEPEKNKVLVLGDPVNIRELPGVIIRFFIGLDHYENYIAEIDYGGWQPGHPEILDLLESISKCAGQKNRIKMFNIAENLGINWPVDNNGIPAYLRSVKLFYCTIEGTLFEYVWKDVSELN